MNFNHIKCDAFMLLWIKRKEIKDKTDGTGCKGYSVCWQGGIKITKEIQINDCKGACMLCMRNGNREYRLKKLLFDKDSNEL